MVKDIELCKEMEKVVTELRGEFGDEFDKVSAGVWNSLIGKAEAEAYDNIKMLPKDKE